MQWQNTHFKHIAYKMIMTVKNFHFLEVVKKIEVIKTEKAFDEKVL